MIKKKWIEVENECLGPDKNFRDWEIYLFIHLCKTIQRKTKHGINEFTQCFRTIKQIKGKSKREVINQMCNFLKKKNVILLAAKKR